MTSKYSKDWKGNGIGRYKPPPTKLLYKGILCLSYGLWRVGFFAVFF